MQRRATARISLKEKALQLLGMRDYSRAEMHNKLLQWLRARAMTERRRQAGYKAETEAQWAADAEAETSTSVAHHAADTDTASLAADWLAQQHAQIEALLDALQAKGYLNDQRAAESLLRQRAGRLGGMRLRQELQRRGISEEISNALLTEVAGTEQERAFALWQKKFGTLPATANERARQMRFLASRGFGSDTIRIVFKQAQEEEPDGPGSN